MQIQFDTQLMANQLPGGTVSSFSRVEMAPSSDGNVIIFTIDHQQQLTVWLSSSTGYTRWVQVPCKLAGGIVPGIIDFDIISNHAGGRGDGSIDLLLVTHTHDGTNEHRDIYYFPAVKATADPEAWTLLFAAAVPLSTGLLPTKARLGLMPKPYRSVLALGAPADGQGWEGRWLEFNTSGQPDSNRKLLLPSDVASAIDVDAACAVVRLPDRPGLVEGYYFYHSHYVPLAKAYLEFVALGSSSSEFLVFPVPSLEGKIDTWRPMQSMRSMLLPSGETATFFNTERFEVGVLEFDRVLKSVPPLPAATSLPAYASADVGLHAFLGPAKATQVERTTYRFEAVERSESSGYFLRQTTGGLYGQDSTLVCGEVDNFCACMCVDPSTGMDTLHILVCYSQGEVELLTQDSSSGIWQRHTLINDDLSKLHTVDSYTTRITVVDDTSAPIANATVTLRPEYPTFAYINGKPVHLSSFAPTSVSTAVGGEITIVTRATNLGAPEMDVEVILDPPAWPAAGGNICLSQNGPLRTSVTAKLNQAEKPLNKLRAVQSGQQIKEAIGSDGRKLFAHLDIRTCNQAHTSLVKFLKAYDSTQTSRKTNKAGTTKRTVVATTLFSWRSGQLSIEECNGESALLAGARAKRSTSRAADEPLGDPFGDIMGYLWAGPESDITVALEELGDDLYQIVVPIGDVLWSAIITVGGQALEAVNWVLQQTLGVDFDDMMDWLGFLFDWDDILANKDAYKKLFELSQASLLAQLPQYKTAIKDAANQLRTWIAQPPPYPPEAEKLLGRKTTEGPQGMPDPGGSGYSSTESQWGNQKLSAYGASAETDSSVNLDFLSEIISIIEQETEIFTGAIDKLYGFATSGEITSKTLLEVVDFVLGVLEGALIDAGETLALGFESILERLATAFATLLNQRIDIPVLTSFYETVLVPDGTFTLLDCLALITSVCVTVGYKATQNRNLLTPEQLAAIRVASSLDALFAALVLPDSGPLPRTAFELDAFLNAFISVAAATTKTGYVIMWSADLWASEPGMPRSFQVNAMKAGFDFMSWGVSMSWVMYKLSKAQDPAVVQALRSNLSVVGLGLLNRVKDGYDLWYIAQKTSNPYSNTFMLLEMAIPGMIGAIFNTILIIKLANLPVPDNANVDYWRTLIALPVIHNYDTAVYSILACERETTGEVQFYLRAARTVANALRPTLGFVSTGVLFKCDKERWATPGSIGE